MATVCFVFFNKRGRAEFEGWTQAKPYSVYEGVAHFPVFEGFFESAAGFKILQFFTAVSCPKDTVKTEAGIFWTGILYSLAIPYNIYDYYNFPQLSAVASCNEFDEAAGSLFHMNE